MPLVKPRRRVGVAGFYASPRLRSSGVPLDGPKIDPISRVAPTARGLSPQCTFRTLRGLSPCGNCVHLGGCPHAPRGLSPCGKCVHPGVCPRVGNGTDGTNRTYASYGSPGSYVAAGLWVLPGHLCTPGVCPRVGWGLSPCGNCVHRGVCPRVGNVHRGVCPHSGIVYTAGSVPGWGMGRMGRIGPMRRIGPLGPILVALGVCPWAGAWDRDRLGRVPGEAGTGISRASGMFPNSGDCIIMRVQTFRSFNFANPCLSIQILRPP
ncbi:hypothetical protein TBK1r_08510 [Stieleria magnilauensis]|uniref:Uncharacterized protein n=1 Tax=Stieleria magnilauensis TaxID=2527963 RepID=A0ABX5XIX1_9BACT|nr:hypothetical protein TBK1r_08510 [Planctomycetes bacterium TBK1r]